VSSTVRRYSCCGYFSLYKNYFLLISVLNYCIFKVQGIGIVNRTFKGSHSVVLFRTEIKTKSV
jgi:hypothetical protein